MPQNNLGVESRESLLSRKELASRWGISAETLKRRERQGVLPFIRFSNRIIRYRLNDILRVEQHGLVILATSKLEVSP